MKEIWSDIDEILSATGELIPNIYLGEWDKDASKIQNPPDEILMSVGDDKTVRIKRRVADNSAWIYKALRQLAKNKQPSPAILTTQQPKMERR